MPHDDGKNAQYLLRNVREYSTEPATANGAGLRWESIHKNPNQCSTKVFPGVMKMPEMKRNMEQMELTPCTVTRIPVPVVFRFLKKRNAVLTEQFYYPQSEPEENWTMPKAKSCS